MKVNVHHAKTNLSRLILRAEAGEEVVIARDGKPVVRLVPIDFGARKLHKPGALKGKLQVPDDFLKPDHAFDKQIEELFYQSPILSEPRQQRGRANRRKR